MQSAMNLAVFISWFFQVSWFLMGSVFGVGMTLLLVAPVFRFQRRFVLRRKWKADKPRRVVDGLFPEWQEYDPDMPGIAKKCVCHGRRIHPGEKVLTWPEVGPMDVLHIAVYCESAKEQLWQGL
jgi:hypothetical protein